MGSCFSMHVFRNMWQIKYYIKKSFLCCKCHRKIGMFMI
ncbi:hypothetical protein CLOBOL_01949 [Enterocloster bolteae ATCC BAA-613]|uniref:Uncharacterized protein n=1 Tax=Enterocloster bolteae (strain ATCC BAA-613 / DSM 15670 / CCUG 46953 / JCM 12243 / WAL 16351) TaxID=411902 RepID=A8RML6_ENTBW|nr:hypothetical protein CLOBOL_01949 [Enterocloster bolteae ATCC BAA-613]